MRSIRKDSKTRCYHVVIRGINRQQIFETSADHRLFLSSLQDITERCFVFVHAYCLMGNHVHLLLEAEDHGLISEFMKALEDSFVYRFNKAHGRCGVLFQGRFHSVPIENERQYLSALRYIHQNPMRAGIEPEPGRYPWSSYGRYYRRRSRDFLYRARVLEHFPDMKSFAEFMRTPAAASDTVRWRSRGRLDDGLVIRLICELASCRDLAQAQALEPEARNRLIRELVEHRVPQVTIGRMLGVSESTVSRVLRGGGDGRK